jgi:hypothetical protein
MVAFAVCDRGVDSTLSLWCYRNVIDNSKFAIKPLSLAVFIDVWVVASYC